MMAGLKAMMERRNDLAHGQYSQVIVIGEEGQLEGLKLARWHRQSKVHDLDNMKELDLDSLEKELAHLENLLDPLDELSQLALEFVPSDKDSDGVKTHHAGTSIFAEVARNLLGLVGLEQTDLRVEK